MELRDVRRSSYCYEYKCVEVGTAERQIGIRDAKTGEAIVVSRRAFRRFISAIR